MLAKITSKNQITLPKAIVKQLPEVGYFEVSLRKGEVVLRPVEVTVPGERLKAVRAKIRALGLTEKAVEQAIRWARDRET
ncbi:MAG: AbrB/MazE/SpoVT family DNA-binding domain-containing protein [Candidatus Methylomirabilis oxyfera]|nr:AbrB/MazE/SpoVT family DNA-binding domain-containing protein [Candidatus Methylomirabilis oxyfera]